MLSQKEDASSYEFKETRLLHIKKLNDVKRVYALVLARLAGVFELGKEGL